jgi:hypothetical protein
VTAVSSSQLRVARDPALGLVVRIFVGAVVERWNVSDATRDDLRLAASELFSAAVEAGDGEDVSFTLTLADRSVAFEAHGLDAAGAEGSPAPVRDGRLDLVRALFPSVSVDGAVRIDVPLEDRPAR